MTEPDSGTRAHATATLSRSAARLRLLGLTAAVAAGAVVAVNASPDVEAIRAWTLQTGWVAPLVFVVLYALLVVALVPGSVVTLAGGVLFGVALGSLLAIVGATLGATVSFFLARRAGRRAVERLASDRIRRVDRWLARRGPAAVITLRLVPLVPFSIANYAAGVSGIRTRHYLLGTTIGIVPGTVAYTVIGARFTSPTDPLFLAAVAGLVVLAVAGSIVAARVERRRSAPAGSVRADARSTPGE